MLGLLVFRFVMMFLLFDRCFLFWMVVVADICDENW